MDAVSTVVVAAGGRLERVSCQPPLTVRQVRSDDPGCCALCLVGTSAGPLAGDDLELNLVVRAGAVASLQATGVSLAQGDHHGQSSMRTNVALDASATLRAKPAPVVVAHGGHVDVSVNLALGPDAHVEWRELVVLGRSGEPAGGALLRWDVTRAGRPVLRQAVDLTDPQLLAWPGMLAGGRVVATALLTGPTVQARTVVASDRAVAARLDEHTLLVTVVGSDALSVGSALDDLLEATFVRTPSEISR